LTYYRGLLLQFERELGIMTANQSFTLPYWNWAHSTSSDADPTIRWLGGDGTTNALYPDLCRLGTWTGRGGCYCPLERVFHDWSVPTLWADTSSGVTVQRTFGCLQRIAPSLPTDDMIDFALSLNTYWDADDNVDSFARFLTGHLVEGSLHTWPAAEGPDMLPRVWNWLGGTSTGPELAGYREDVSNPAADPLFWMSLGYADLVLERWIRQQTELSLEALPLDQAVSGLNRDDHLPGLTPLTTNADLFVESSSLGYDFDFFEAGQGTDLHFDYIT